MDIGIRDLLALKGLKLLPTCRFVRHQSNRHPVEELLRNGWLELYQAYQSRPVFHKVEQIVSFYGLSGTRAAFYGVYSVLGCKSAREGEIILGCPWVEEWRQSSAFFYELECQSEFNDLRDRLVIDWGPATRSWIQKATNKALLEIQEAGRRLPPFDDYLEFSLTFSQLRDLFANEEAHREWRARLSAVSGIYLILAEDSGDLYVGSAYGEGGIWARWREYARSGHGGNCKLRDLIRRDPDYPERFRFSVLQILPKTMARDKVIQREAIYKSKLGTRATGLNLN